MLVFQAWDFVTETIVLITKVAPGTLTTAKDKRKIQHLVRTGYSHLCSSL